LNALHQQSLADALLARQVEIVPDPLHSDRLLQLSLEQPGKEGLVAEPFR